MYTWVVDYPNELSELPLNLEYMTQKSINIFK